MTTKIQHELDELATIFERTNPTLPNLEDEFAQYSSAAEEAISNAFEYLVLLHARINSFKAHAELLNTSSHKHSNRSSGNDESIVTAVVKKLELPTIPFPSVVTYGVGITFGSSSIQIYIHKGSQTYKSSITSSTP
uniref:Uncharacterized protein n=1 Tax=Angiostrongylus cantonensis TaxID=6313 RepID=A0A0K0CUA6_ANGCA